MVTLLIFNILVACIEKSEKMDPRKLEELLSLDYSEKNTPCFLLVRTCTDITGETDDFEDLRSICDKNFMVSIHVLI